MGLRDGTIIITMSAGDVFAVSSNDTAMIGKRAIVIDYAVDSLNDARVFDIRYVDQPDQGALAYVAEMEIEETSVNIRSLTHQLLARDKHGHQDL